MPIEPQDGASSRRWPPWRTLVLTGVFAATVFAATDAVLRLASEQERSPPTSAATPVPGTTPEAGATPAPASGDTPATSDPAAKDTAGADTNVEEQAEGPRRAAPPKAAEAEAPEFRESADNNITLPVDI